MKKETVERLLKSGDIRIRQKDMERIKSLIKSAEINASIAKKIELNENSATLVFREIYESIRQLGDAKWWLFGYEPENHEVSLETLKEMSIKEKIKLNHIDRFRKIRHDANYRGYMVSVSQTEEMIEFWDKCGPDIINILLKEAKS
ncbi:hypothetical protein HYZ41_00410 [archaeon]|nr:hypothetical protein [archaeon]